MSTSSNRISKGRSRLSGRDEKERKWGSVRVSASVREKVCHVSVHVFVAACVGHATMID